MTGKTPPRHKQSVPSGREARLAEALRANLMKRKAQQRARVSANGAVAVEDVHADGRRARET